MWDCLSAEQVQRRLIGGRLYPCESQQGMEQHIMRDGKVFQLCGVAHHSGDIFLFLCQRRCVHHEGNPAKGGIIHEFGVMASVLSMQAVAVVAGNDKQAVQLLQPFQQFVPIGISRQYGVVIGIDKLFIRAVCNTEMVAHRPPDAEFVGIAVFRVDVAAEAVEDDECIPGGARPVFCPA